PGELDRLADQGLVQPERGGTANHPQRAGEQRLVQLAVDAQQGPDARAGRLGRDGQPAQLEQALHADHRLGLDRGRQLGVGLARAAEHDLGRAADAGPGDAGQGQFAPGGHLEPVDLGGQRGEHVGMSVRLHRVQQGGVLGQRRPYRRGGLRQGCPVIYVRAARRRGRQHRGEDPLGNGFGHARWYPAPTIGAVILGAGSAGSAVEVWAQAERYLGVGTRTYSRFSADLDVDDAYHPQRGLTSFEVPTYWIPDGVGSYLTNGLASDLHALY